MPRVMAAGPPHLPLVLNLPPPPLGRVVWSWVRVTLIPLVLWIGYFTVLVVACDLWPERAGDPSWVQPFTKIILVSTAGTLATTTLMYLPQAVRWPRRETVVEVTADRVVVVHVDPWGRRRTEWPAAQVGFVRQRGSVVDLYDAPPAKARRRIRVHKFLNPAEARAVAESLRRALRL